MSSVRKQNAPTKSKPTKTIARSKENKDDTEEKEKKKVVVPKTEVKVMATSSSRNTTVKKRVSNSPTSNRVSKTQYYPDKTLYSNALGTASPRIKQSLTNPTPSKMPAKTTKTPKVTSDRTSRISQKAVKVSPKAPVPSKEKTKSLTEVKKEMRDKLKKTTVKSPDVSSSSSLLERPRTATLKRPSIVSTNIAGPETSKLKKMAKDKVDSIAETISTQMETDTEVPSETIPDAESGASKAKPDSDDTDQYEDDFDSYASDFEEYNSDPEATENSSDPTDVSTNGEVTSSDENEETPLPKEVSSPPRRVNSAEEERKLDSGNFDMPPETSDHKRLQVLDRIKEHEPVLSSLSDEGFEEQKTSLQFVNFAEAKKERQRQKSARKINKRGEELMSMIRLDQQNFTLFDLPAQSYDVFIKSFGNRNSTQVASQTGDDRVDEEVQTDVIQVSNKWTQFPIDKITKSKNLHQFRDELLGVGSDTLEVNLLKEPSILEYNIYSLEKFLNEKEKLISELLREDQYSHSAEFTPGKFPFSQGYLLLNTEEMGPAKRVTFSSSNKNPKIITIHDTKDFRSMGYVWSLLKPTVPEDQFVAFGDISDVTFGIDNDKLIFGGFKDGCLAVWDLLEDFSDPNLRPPSFLTEVDFDSTEMVVRVLCFRSQKSNDFQIITLNESGKVVIWELVITPTESLGLNRISLIRNSTILLGVLHQTGPSLQCTDLCLSQDDSNNFYVSTNFGVILHSLVSGTRTNPKQYSNGLSSPLNVLETCPHNFLYFLAGCDTGEVILHSKQFEKPLMTISNELSEASVTAIQWSRNRPSIFYTLDSENNINIWDLSVSELTPQCSVHLKDKVRSMKISPLQTETSYIVIITGDGKVHLHLLNQEHGMQEVEVYAGDLRRLNNYVQKL